jgi:hypothetical protein
VIPPTLPTLGYCTHEAHPSARCSLGTGPKVGKVGGLALSQWQESVTRLPTMRPRSAKSRRLVGTAWIPPAEVCSDDKVRHDSSAADTTFTLLPHWMHHQLRLRSPRAAVAP